MFDVGSGEGGTICYTDFKNNLTDTQSLDPPQYCDAPSHRNATECPNLYATMPQRAKKGKGGRSREVAGVVRWLFRPPGRRGRAVGRVILARPLRRQGGGMSASSIAARAAAARAGGDARSMTLSSFER